MNAIQLIGISSVLGAVASFFGGFLTSRRRYRGDQAVLEQQQEVGQHLEQQVYLLQAEMMACQGREVNLAALLGASEEQAAALREELDRINEQNLVQEQQRAGLARAQADAREQAQNVRRAQEQLQQLEEQLTETLAKLREAEAEAAQAPIRARPRVAEGGDELGRMREELGQARERLRRAAELEEQVRRLQAEVARQREELELSTASLQAVIEQLAAADTTRGVALADGSGLAVAESGEHTQEIAAVAAQLTKEIDKIVWLLPLSTLQQIALEDIETQTMTIHPIVARDRSELILTTLGDGPGPRREELREVMARAAAMVAG